MRMTGGKAIFEIFRQEEVKYVFGLPGATEIRFMDSLEDFPDIKFILGLHEVVAMGAAEGYARTSGKVGVLNLHTNTGLAAGLPLLSNAFTGGAPLIVTAGQQDTRLKAVEPHLTGDLVRIASPFTKWGTEITRVEDIPLIFRRAFKEALHPPTGPVFISLPQNILEEQFDLEYETGSRQYHLTQPDPRVITLAANLLREVKNPVIVVQDGITKSQALNEVVELAELIGARVYQPWMGDVNFPMDHPLYAGDLDLVGQGAREMFSSVDVLLAIGTPAFSPSSYNPVPLLTSRTKLIHIDMVPWEIGKNLPVAAGIEGDIKTSLSELIRTLKKKLTPQAKSEAKTRISTAGLEKTRADKEFASKAIAAKNAASISTEFLMSAIKTSLKPGTRIVDDCWSSSTLLRRTLAFKEPLSFQRARSGGSIGFGLPGAIGVKLASPDRSVVCVSGDGSALWSIQSLWTAARYNIPICYIIIANNRYQMVRNAKIQLMGPESEGRYLGTDLSQPRVDFCRIAEGLGVKARLVEKPSDLKPALGLAFNMDEVNLVEVRTA